MLRMCGVVLRVRRVVRRACRAMLQVLKVARAPAVSCGGPVRRCSNPADRPADPHGRAAGRGTRAQETCGCPADLRARASNERRAARDARDSAADGRRSAADAQGRASEQPRRAAGRQGRPAHTQGRALTSPSGTAGLQRATTALYGVPAITWSAHHMCTALRQGQKRRASPVRSRFMLAKLPAPRSRTSDQRPRPSAEKCDFSSAPVSTVPLVPKNVAGFGGRSAQAARFRSCRVWVRLIQAELRRAAAPA